MPGTGVPDISSFIDAARSSSGPCKYVRTTTPEQRAAIRNEYAKGIHAWTAFHRWLQAQETQCAAYLIEYHLTTGHTDDV